MSGQIIHIDYEKRLTTVTTFVDPTSGQVAFDCIKDFADKMDGDGRVETMGTHAFRVMDVSGKYPMLEYFVLDDAS